MNNSKSEEKFNINANKFCFTANHKEAKMYNLNNV